MSKGDRSSKIGHAALLANNSVLVRHDRSLFVIGLQKRKKGLHIDSGTSNLRNQIKVNAWKQLFSIKKNNLDFGHVFGNLGKSRVILGFYSFRAWDFVKSRLATLFQSLGILLIVSI